jgi:ABC-type phosphate transport system substrate-binding protein
MRTTRLVSMTLTAVAAAALLAACSTSEPADTAMSAIAAASEAASQANGAGSADMVALCDQMVADGLSAEDATALAESNGYSARIGTIDGQPQALTMDYRVDRFTFDVTNGVVVACTYG